MWRLYARSCHEGALRSLRSRRFTPSPFTFFASQRIAQLGLSAGSATEVASSARCLTTAPIAGAERRPPEFLCRSVGRKIGQHDEPWGGHEQPGPLIGDLCQDGLCRPVPDSHTVAAGGPTHGSLLDPSDEWPRRLPRESLCFPSRRRAITARGSSSVQRGVFFIAARGRFRYPRPRSGGRRGSFTSRAGPKRRGGLNRWRRRLRWRPNDRGLERSSRRANHHA